MSNFILFDQSKYEYICKLCVQTYTQLWYLHGNLQIANHFVRTCVDAHDGYSKI